MRETLYGSWTSVFFPQNKGHYFRRLGPGLLYKTEPFEQRRMKQLQH